MVEHLFYTQEVVGSSPAPPTRFWRRQNLSARDKRNMKQWVLYILECADEISGGRSSVWLERQIVDLEVASSSLVAPAIFIPDKDL